MVLILVPLLVLVLMPVLELMLVFVFSFGLGASFGLSDGAGVVASFGVGVGVSDGVGDSFGVGVRASFGGSVGVSLEASSGVSGDAGGLPEITGLIINLQDHLIKVKREVSSLAEENMELRSVIGNLGAIEKVSREGRWKAVKKSVMKTTFIRGKKK